MTHLAEPETAEEVLGQKSTVGRQVHAVLHRMPALSPLVVLIAAGIAFGLVNSRFFLPGNLSIVLQQASIVGSLAVGQTLIILTAGIDLSIGAVMVLSSLVMAKLVSNDGVPGPIALLIGLVVAVLAGAVNGVLVTRIKLPPFIVTLGTLSIFTAVTLIYAQGQTISLPPNTFLTWTGDTISIGSPNVFAHDAWRRISSSRASDDASRRPPSWCQPGSLPVSSFSSAYSPTEYCISFVSESDERSWPTRPAECQVEPCVSWYCSTRTESVQPSFARW